MAQYKKAGIEKGEGEGENEISKKEEKVKAGVHSLTDAEKKTLLEQVKKEVEFAKDHMKPKIQKYYRNLKMFNNQRRDPDRVGDLLMFTLHQTLLASFVDDTFNVSFGKSDKLSNAELVAASDYDEMEKDYLDYIWNWNTLFYGRAVVLNMTFDRENLIPVPKAIDPLIMLRDPKAASLNGSSHGRPARFWGWVTEMSYQEIKSNPVKYDVNSLSDKDNQKSYLNEELIKNARQARDDAQGRNDSSYIDAGESDNKIYELIEWFTHFNGKKCYITVTSDCKGLVSYNVLKNQKRWPAVDKACLPSPNDWDGVSVPDLAEDKQRAKAILANLALTSLMRDVDGQRIYDASRIDNRTPLSNGGDIAVNGPINNAVGVVPTNTPNLALFDYVTQFLDTTSQKATATPDMQQGSLSGQNRTLGELNLVAQKTDTRYGLMAKLFAMAEKRFWEMWYELYEEHMLETDNKEIEVGDEYSEGARLFQKKDFISPDKKGLKVKVKSAALEDAKRMRALTTFSQYYQIIMQMPNANKNLLTRKLGRLFGLTEAELDLFLPKDIEELRAEDENKLLAEGRMVEVDYDDDHNLHLSVHAYAEPTIQTRSHIAAHRYMLAAQRGMNIAMGSQAPQPQQMGQGQSTNEPPQPGGLMRQSEDAAINSNMTKEGQAMGQIMTNAQ